MQNSPLIHSSDTYKFKTRDVKAVRLLKIVVGIAILYTLYFAQSIIIPLVFSAFVALLLSPLVRKLKAFYIPRSISAVVLLAALIAPFSILCIELVEPVERWIKVVPKYTQQVTEQIDEISDAFDVEKQQRMAAKEKQSKSFFGNWFSDDAEEEPEDVEQEGTSVKEKIKQGSLDMLLTSLAAMPIFLAQLFGCIILILFLLIYGSPLFSVFISDFPIVENKEKANCLVQRIQHELSKYILTISLVNLGLGVATAACLAYFGVQDYLLWGAIISFLNFVPYVGPIIGLTILSMVGVVQFGATSLALLPGGVFLVLNIIESQFVTPAVLGTSMRVNPLIIIVWLALTGWLWGIIGILLAVPLLVCIKLIIEQIEVLPHWLKLIEASEADCRPLNPK
ncbi:AI-2E family transporter [Aliiglaciecola lipolytica]|uniref:Transport protein n=1 Tax=Aliiglaciecola lipolytica E3 TaxID=1127673 RepID=K6YID5_9ALTE|nr:AI-2E family transporter [Aliiglaciecola lipolytica]GAC16348.1 transport protein [Aliiglaciecola lipolytica E3]